MKKFLKIAGLVILQFVLAVILLMAVIWVCTGADFHYSGNPKYNECMKKADTPAELEKEGDYNEQ